MRISSIFLFVFLLNSNLFAAASFTSEFGKSPASPYGEYTNKVSYTFPQLTVNKKGVTTGSWTTLVKVNKAAKADSKPTYGFIWAAWVTGSNHTIDFIPNKDGLNNLMSKAVSANAVQDKAHKMPEGTTLDYRSVKKIHIQAGGAGTSETATVYQGTTTSAPVLFTVKNAYKDNNDVGISINNIEIKDDGIYGDILYYRGTGIVGTGTIYNWYPVGRKRIDNMLFSTKCTGGRSPISVFFIPANGLISGSISTDKTTVKPGDTVNVNWETEK